jgi:hypothetical protein
MYIIPHVIQMTQTVWAIFTVYKYESRMFYLLILFFSYLQVFCENTFDL